MKFIIKHSLLLLILAIIIVGTVAGWFLYWQVTAPKCIKWTEQSINSCIEYEK
jgi:hypothetical protein